jgi:dynein heavy chain
MLADEATLGQWKLQGLPTDDASLHNGIIISRTVKWPLLLDPQGLGTAWIRKREDGIKTVTAMDKRCKETLMDCLKYGKPLLLQCTCPSADLDAAWDNVIDKSWLVKGRSLAVYVGEHEVLADRAFRMYITTRHANPAMTADFATRLTAIAFGASPEAVQDILLDKV